MSSKLTWLGHGAWSIATGEYHVLLDPYIGESPTAPVGPDELEADHILISHGHGDHLGDCVSIAQRTGATVIANFEICQWLAKQGVENTHPMNLGGSCAQPFGTVKMTLAHHSSSLPDGSYGGCPCGFLLGLAGGNVYFACDTALFYDMKLIGKAGLDLAVVPIGDNFTMGPGDATRAVEMLMPRRVVPVHVNTWPVIEQDVEAWAEHVLRTTSVEPVILKPGESISL